jgi:hypothetical protein
VKVDDLPMSANDGPAQTGNPLHAFNAGDATQAKWIGQVRHDGLMLCEHRTGSEWRDLYRFKPRNWVLILTYF